ncbi:MAG: toxin-antitoxin system toxin subunit [Desulforudis sp.]|jgi:DNA-binding transcriptional ArsR family regulator|nr:MAG: toxin-antitoxin system toxin subunit [Desulforudis sp.]
MTILAEIVSSKIRAEVFRLLFADSAVELHMRELARISGMAIGTVQTELKKLSRLGLVASRRDGNRLYFRAQQAHPLYPDIRSLVLKTTGLADVLRQALSKSKRIQYAFIFGSFACHEQNAESDVDMMIIGELGLREVTALLSEAGAANLISREINPFVLTAEEFRKRKAAGDHFISQLIGSQKIFLVGNQDEFEAMG